MELHPYLELDTRPNPNWWYVMTATGECPSMRVGHTCTYIPGHAESDGKVYLIGGANPSGPFCETYVLDLNTRMWDIVESPGLRARYEHAAFVPSCSPEKIFVFGGANQAGNLNDVQVLDTSTFTWTTVAVSGTPPAPRTHHTTAAVGNQLIVYSGGHTGADPVGDRQVHCFDASNGAWSVLNLKGESPKPRHGHVMVAVGQRVYMHGGMAGSTFYDDLHILDMEKNSWRSFKKNRTFPSARAAHGAVASGMNIFIFGGMNRDGALDDLYKLDTASLMWSRVELQGPPPACRLDFALCAVELRVPAEGGTNSLGAGDLAETSSHALEMIEKKLKPGSASSCDSQTDACVAEALPFTEASEAVQEKRPETEGLPSSVTDQKEEGTTSSDVIVHPQNKNVMKLVFLHGGMDTEGEIFDDTLVFLL